jgi:DNA polymerase-3 subunit gamma/tau
MADDAPGVPDLEPPAPEPSHGLPPARPRAAHRTAPAPSVAGHGVPLPEGPRSWAGFRQFAQAVQERTGRGVNGLMQAEAQFAEGVLTLECRSQMHCNQIRRGEAFAALTALVNDYFGPETAIEFQIPERSQSNRRDMESLAKAHPLVLSVMDAFEAGFVEARPPEVVVADEPDTQQTETDGE